MLPDQDGAPVIIEPVGGGELRRVSRQEVKKCKVPTPAPRRKPVQLPTFPTVTEQLPAKEFVDWETYDSSSTSEEESEHPPVRRTSRTTAGQHSNRQRLPRTANVRAVGTTDIFPEFLRTVQTMMEFCLTERQ
ncbi:hypothetical protein ACOMHN_017408 [Nucella lapillus]